jgi:ABC-type multidrug transport system fused ATPase/permease subunit
MMQGLSMALILPLLESIISGELNNKFSRIMMPRVSKFEPAYWPLITTAVFFIFTLLKVLLQVYNKYYEVRFINDLSLGWKLQLFRKYMQSSYSYVIDHKQGELIYNLDTEAKKAGNLMIYYIDYIYLYFAFFFQYIVLLAASIRITMIITLLFAGMYLAVVVLGKRYLHGLGRKLIVVSQSMSSLAVESIAASAR